MRSFEPIKEFMLKEQRSQHEIALFKSLFDRYISDKEKKVDWQNISSPVDQSIINYDQIPICNQEKAKQLLSELVVCRLNGGLGTGMGCLGPKSAIEIRDGKSFLDLIVSQIQNLNDSYQVNVPLLLMNSFNTDHDTKKIIKKYDTDLDIQTFQQNKFPRLTKDSLTPLSAESFGDQAFYPPGHGDIFNSINDSGILNKLIEQGKKYIYIANADNLGASVDLNILNLISETSAPYIMEVTNKTRADVKGGTLVNTKDNPLHLLEFAQVPFEYREEFKSVKKFKIFNTNNIWLNLIKLKQKLNEGSLNLDLIVNKKTIKYHQILQLEVAIGSGISSFKDSLAVKVPRTRFLPVKKTNDLLLVQSNLFIEENGVLRMNPDRQFAGLPLIRLGENFTTIEDYQKRFQGIPDILELDLLTVVGNVFFGKNIVLKGNVILVCDGEALHIPDSAELENKVLTGNIQLAEL
jgi:UTP--glucose-1-phosphate uridylyltransferase